MNKLGIIVQGYNPKSESIKKTINSLKMQSDKNFDIYFFDNGSEKSWIKDINLTKDGEISWRYIRKTTNEGIANGRNYIADKIKNKFMFRLDDGDVISPETVAEINKSINDGNDMLLIHREKDRISLNAPSSCVILKENFVNFPESNGFYTEDTNSVIYYLSISKNPIVLKNAKYTQEINSRWFNSDKMKNFIMENNEIRFWNKKVSKNAISKINAKTYPRNCKIKKGQNLHALMARLFYFSAMSLMRPWLEKASRSEYKEFMAFIKKYKIFTWNPARSIWPITLFRLFTFYKR